MAKIIFWCSAKSFIQSIIIQRLNMIKREVSYNSLTQLQVELLLEKLLLIFSDRAMTKLIIKHAGTIRILPNAKHAETNDRVNRMIAVAEKFNMEFETIEQ